MKANQYILKYEQFASSVEENPSSRRDPQQVSTESISQNTWDHQNSKPISEAHETKPNPGRGSAGALVERRKSNPGRGSAAESAERRNALKAEPLSPSMASAKLDVHGHEQRFIRWKERVLDGGCEPDLTEGNFKTLCRFVFDMEMGVNVSPQSKKGRRSYVRLNSIRQRMAQLMRMLQERNVPDMTKLSQEAITEFYSEMRSGMVTRGDGLPYKSVATYAKVFCAFWNWHMRVSRRQGITVEDITIDIDRTEKEKSRFVYFTKDQLDQMLPFFDHDEQLILLFCFDSMIRSPTELLSLSVRDVYRQGDDVWLNVPNEIAKNNRGRTFNLVYSGDELQSYIQHHGLKPEDHLFDFQPRLLTKKLQEVAVQVFGDTISDPRAGEYWRNITLYDFRHSGAIHFRVLAKDNPASISLDAVRERGGWADFKQLNNYTRFLGIDGKIEKIGLLIREEASELHEEVEQLREENRMMREQLKAEIKDELSQMKRQFEVDLAERKFARRYLAGHPSTQK